MLGRVNTTCLVFGEWSESLGPCSIFSFQGVYPKRRPKNGTASSDCRPIGMVPGGSVWGGSPNWQSQTRRVCSPLWQSPMAVPYGSPLWFQCFLVNLGPLRVLRRRQPTPPSRDPHRPSDPSDPVGSGRIEPGTWFDVPVERLPSRLTRWTSARTTHPHV